MDYMRSPAAPGFMILVVVVAILFSGILRTWEPAPAREPASTEAFGCLMAATDSSPGTQDQEPVSMVITGVPAFVQGDWPGEDGRIVPAGCGPAAARMLLAYYDQCHGYGMLIRDRPVEAIQELHERMHTITVSWVGARMGYTVPMLFRSGLRSFIEARYSDGVTIGKETGSLDEVFEKSVSLIKEYKPHIILFDWAGMGWIFPCHFSVVVGYRLEGETKELVINTGWGYDFQILDMTDPVVWPATLYWIEEIKDPADGEAGCKIGPGSAQGMWFTDADGNYQLAPTMHLHFDQTNTDVWRMSESSTLFFSGPEGRIGVSYWY